jgi:hypothetical protein
MIGTDARGRTPPQLPNAPISTLDPATLKPDKSHQEYFWKTYAGASRQARRAFRRRTDV